MLDNKLNKVSLKGSLVSLVISLVGLLPLVLARRLGALVGSICWLFQERGSRTTRANIDVCYPELNDAERLELAKQSIRETGMLAAEICLIWRRDSQWLNKKIKKVYGESLLITEIAKARGVMILAPHLGNWELLGQVFPRYGPFIALYQPPKQEFLEPLTVKARGKNGARLVSTDQRGVVSLLRAIKAGDMTAILPDQNPTKGSGTFIPFFGKPAYTMTLIHGLIQRSGCSVIFSFAKRVKDGFEIYYLEPPEDIYSADKQTSLRALNLGVENCIGYCPEQYQWEYKRFKENP